MTAFQILLAVTLKGLLVALLVKKGWWPDWPKYYRRKDEHRRVIAAYEAWCDKTGVRPADDPNFALLSSETRPSSGPEKPAIP